MKILLGVTGGVAAKLTPKLVKMLLDKGHEVQVVTTEKALYFFKLNPREAGNSVFPDETIQNVAVWTDKDEWIGDIYQRDQLIPHIALTQWADVFAIVPLTANTIGKMAHGICDNLLTSEVMAWSVKKPLVLAPAMNTQMWLNPIMQKNLRDISIDRNTIVVNPVEKKLACGDTGMGALADLEVIVSTIETFGKSGEWTE